MNDTTYTLVQTNKERTVAARGIYGKKTGSKTKYCGLPSDHLTEAEKRKLNGPVKSYDMSIPHTYEELKLWPEDLQRQYLGKLLTMGPTNVQIGDMLHCHYNTVGILLKRLGVTTGKKGPRHRANPKQVRAWVQFTKGTITQGEPEITDNQDTESTTTPQQEITLNASTLATLLDYLAEHYTITIKLERRTES